MCAGSLLSRDRARERARARLRGRRGPTQVRGLARFGGGAVRLGCLRVLPDGQPLPPRPRDAAREPIGWDEAVERLLCADFNRRQSRCGHVFQARFRSILVETESYLLAVCRYVVLNPVRARLCSRPDGWSWSGYRGTAGIEAGEMFLAVDSLLVRFARWRRAGSGRYRAFVAAGLGEPSGRADSAASAWARKSFCVTGSGARFYRRCHESRSSHCRRRSSDSSAGTDPAPIATADREHGYTLREIAEYLGCHYSTVSLHARRRADGNGLRRGPRPPWPGDGSDPYTSA